MTPRPPFEALDATTQRAEAVLTHGHGHRCQIGPHHGRSNGRCIWCRHGAAVPPLPAILRVTDRGVLRLSYSARDDYGVTDLRLVVSRGTDNFEFKLPLVAGRGRCRTVRGRHKGGSFQDLTAHSWAGLDVELRLVARDAMGQIGASAPLAMTLPERKFYHPVARAIIEQRKRLAADWREHQLAAAN